MRPFGLALVVLLVVLAGCGGAGPSGGDTPTGTVTPAPVPDDGAVDRSRPDRLAPGLAADGVFDAGRLARAHGDRLAGRPFTRSRTDTRRVNGSLRQRDETTLMYAAGGDRFRYRLNQTTQRAEGVERSEIDRYADGTRVLVASRDANGTEYEVLAGPNGDAYTPAQVFPRNATGEASLARLFRLVDVTVTDRRTVDGRRHYRVETPARQDIPPLRNISLVATVTESGLIRDYRLSYDITRGEQRVRIVVTVAYDRLDRTTVEPPPWLPEAKAATGVGTNGTTAAGPTPTGTATPPGSG